MTNHISGKAGGTGDGWAATRHGHEPWYRPDEAERFYPDIEVNGKRVVFMNAGVPRTKSPVGECQRCGCPSAGGYRDLCTPCYVHRIRMRRTGTLGQDRFSDPFLDALVD